MTNKDFIKGNSMIAEFMGGVLNDEWYRLTPAPHGLETRQCADCHKDELMYHKSWDWLMPVVKKLASFMAVFMDDCIKIIAKGRKMEDIEGLWLWVVETVTEWKENVISLKQK